MRVYTNDLGRYKAIAEKYKKSKEDVKLSLPIEFEGELYRVLEFFKSSFFEKSTTGILVLTNDGFKVSDKRIQREVVKLSYYLDILLDDDSIERLKKAITPEKELKKETINYNDAIDVLTLLNSENVKGIDTVINVLKKLPESKIENNRALEEYLKVTKKYEDVDLAVNSEMIEELLKSYRDMLLVNFRRVKEINKGRAYYDSLKDLSSKNKKKISNKFNGMSQRYTRLEMILDKLKNILIIYDRILDMNEERYIEFLKTQDNVNINSKLKLIRE